MLKGSIEWEHVHGEGLVLRIKRPTGCGDRTREVGEHFVGASKEVLLTVRFLLDAAIQHIEEKEKRAEQKRTRIEVE